MCNLIFKKKFNVKGSPFTLDKSQKNIVYLNKEYKAYKFSINKINISTETLIEEIIQENDGYASLTADLSINELDAKIAYFDDGFYLKIIDLNSLAKEEYAPIAETKSDTYNKISFIRNKVIFNYAQSIEIININELKNIKFLSFKDCNEYESPLFCLSNNNKYMLAVFQNDLEEHSILNIIDLQTFDTIQTFTGRKLFFCMNVIFSEQDDKIIELSGQYEMEHLGFHIYLYSLKNFEELSHIYIPNDGSVKKLLIREPISGKVLLLIENKDNLKTFYEIDFISNKLIKLTDLETSLNNIISKAVITDNGKYLIIGDGNNIEVFDILN